MQQNPQRPQKPVKIRLRLGTVRKTQSPKSRKRALIVRRGYSPIGEKNLIKLFIINVFIELRREINRKAERNFQSPERQKEFRRRNSQLNGSKNTIISTILEQTENAEQYTRV